MTHIGKITTPSRRLLEGSPYTPSWLMKPPSIRAFVPRLGGTYGLLTKQVPPGTKSAADEDVNPSTAG